MPVARSVDRLSNADRHLSVALEEWRLEAAGHVADLRSDFEHLEAEAELPGGLFSNAIADAPRLSGRVLRLRRERNVLATRIEVLMTDIAMSKGAAAASVAALRDDVADLGARIGVHRHRVLSICYDAYHVDIGGPVG